MKKTYLLLFILAIGAAMLTACTDDDNNGGTEIPTFLWQNYPSQRQTLGWHKRNTASPISIRLRPMLSLQK